MDTESENIKLTSEEVHLLQNAFQKEEFRKMFAEYIEEINAPDNAAKYEEEMTILEKERGYDIVFLKPESGYVMKLRAGETKSFINVCKNENVGIASCKNVVGPDKKMGCSWDIPMMFTKPRNELDKKGSSCMVYDVMFNPNAFSVAKNVKGFRKIMEDSALTYVEKNFSVVFDRSSIKYPRMKYKGTPSRCVLRKKNKYGELNETIDDKKPEILVKKKCDSVMSAKAFSNKLNLGTVGKHHNNRNQFVTPKYTIKYREYTDMSDYLSGCGNSRKEMIVIIDVPLAHSSDELKVDTSEKHVSLQSVVPAHNYKIEITFQHLVEDIDGKAEFDPKLKQLILTLPLKQPNKHLRDDICLPKNSEPEVEPHGSSLAKSEVTAEHLGVYSAAQEQDDTFKDLEMYSDYSTSDENSHRNTSVSVSVVEETMNCVDDHNDRTPGFTGLQTESENVGDVVISAECGLPFEKYSKYVKRNSSCTAGEVCEFPVLHTYDIQSDISCKGYESHSDFILKFQVKHICPNSVNILHCACNSSMGISYAYELLGSGCLPLKCAHRLSFGTNKKIWQKKINVHITNEDMCLEIKKQEECCFYWETYWFGNHDEPMQALHFSRKFQEMVGKPSPVSGLESPGLKHMEKDEPASNAVSVTSSDFPVIDIQDSKALDHSAPPQTCGSNSSVLHDFDLNALECNKYSNMAIPNNCKSHSTLSVIEKQGSSSAVENHIYCCNGLLKNNNAPQETLGAIAPVTSIQQNTSLKSIDCVDIPCQDSEVCKQLENHAVVCLGNDTGSSEIFEKLKSIATTDVQSEINCRGCIDKDAAKYQDKAIFCESGENLEMMVSSSYKDTFSERHGDHCLKLIEENCDHRINMGSNEGVGGVSSVDKRKNCSTFEVNDSHNSVSLVENGRVAHFSQELCDTLAQHHDNSQANNEQLSELHNLNNAMHCCEAQTDCASFKRDSMKSDIADSFVAPASRQRVIQYAEELSKTTSEDVRNKKPPNSDDEKSCNNIGQPSAFWAHDYTSNMLAASKTTKTDTLFKNTIMFELD